MCKSSRRTHGTAARSVSVVEMLASGAPAARGAEVKAVPLATKTTNGNPKRKASGKEFHAGGAGGNSSCSQPPCRRQ